MAELQYAHYAIVTDGWSKRTAARGTPLINIMIGPDDRPAVFWRVEDGSNAHKNSDWVVELHEVCCCQS